MAEEYTIGTITIRYRSTSFIEGLEVFVDLFDPKGSWLPRVQLTPVGKGLYELINYPFFKLGTYTGIFYECIPGSWLEKKTSQNFRIVRSGRFRGDNVIGG